MCSILSINFKGFSERLLYAWNIQFSWDIHHTNYYLNQLLYLIKSNYLTQSIVSHLYLPSCLPQEKQISSFLFEGIYHELLWPWQLLLPRSVVKQLACLNDAWRNVSSGQVQFLNDVIYKRCSSFQLFIKIELTFSL